ncbi:MAG TPA: alpha-2-macroglobulin family protein, partial [Flavobacterium sp.]|nr:alpha-2-macroglobulin family protein [Flavobacterium sp.]
MKKSAKVDLFTDRSIYRPGQEVHFKGILYLIEKEGNSALENKSFQAILEDDNGDEIDKIILTTNKLGAFSGTFLLPKSIATGEFYIYITELDEYTDKEEEAFWEDISFPDESFSYQVEEYKRPTFEVALEEIKHNVFFDQEVTIKGKANSLAGGAIAHAKVKLEVKSSYYDYETYQSINLIDIRKELLTDEQGNFEYTFAIPSDSFGEMLKEKVTTNKVNYSVEVTDSAGEVRKDNGAFTVSNTSFGLNVYKYGTVKSNEPLVVHAKSYSHNGEFHPISGTVKIYQTLPNSNFYINRSWEEPELSMIDETEFRQLFPNETYSAEDGKTPEKTIVYEEVYATQENQDFTLNIDNWKTGNYELIFETIDEKSGLPIVSSANFEVKNEAEKLATNENFTVEVHAKSNKNQLILETNSLYDNVWFFVEYFDRDATLQSKQFSVKKGTQLIKIPLVNSTENENISYNWFFLKEHQLYSDKGSYTIEQEKKEDEKWLVEWQSWNDKLNPAQQYQWKLLLKNAKTNKAFQGEFLASMYDASLDLFIQNRSWRNKAQKGISQAYILFSSPRKSNTIQQNYLYGSNFYNNINFYWNTWNYFGYDFSNSSYYNDYYHYVPEEIQNNTGTYFQVEVRDAKTGNYISNAMLFNFKNADQTATNEDGFASIVGEKSVLVGVVALGYEEQRLELKKGLTVIHLQPKEGGISTASYDDLFKIKSAWYGIYYHYQNNIADASKSAQDEIRFTEGVLKKDAEMAEILNRMDVGGDYKSSREITGGADKSSKGTGRGEKYSDDENKVVSAVAYTSTISTTTYGVQSVEDTHLDIPLRRNLHETAFFYPHLQTNKDGEVIIDFTAPEALTKWKFRGLAHNKSTDYIYIETLSRTQKDVMIQPNMPRFVRETDEVVLKARVSNTTAQPLNATAMLRLFNTITGEDLTDKIIKTEPLVSVIIEGLSANTVSWTVRVPKNIEGLQYRISVQSGNFTDGEESVILVLSNRQLVTETLPIWQLANENKTYQLTNLIENESKTLENHQLKIEVSNNATWLMMQSFPYLFDYPHQCSEQLFAKYFANVIASNILENSPSIQQLVKEWKENPKSKLEENEELKQILLQETPWMKDLVSNEEQKAQFAHYFDVNRLDDEAEKIEDILTERQLPSGALPWFSGGNENRYITEHIL